MLPLLSVAVQVTVVEPSGKLLPEAGSQTTLTESSQSSVAVGRSNSTWIDSPIELHSTTRSSGQVISGVIVSAATVTLKVQELELPEASVAVAVTVVVPTGKSVPEEGE